MAVAGTGGRMGILDRAEEVCCKGGAGGCSADDGHAVVQVRFSRVVLFDRKKAATGLVASCELLRWFVGVLADGDGVGMEVD